MLLPTAMFPHCLLHFLGLVRIRLLAGAHWRVLTTQDPLVHRATVLPPTGGFSFPPSPGQEEVNAVPLSAEVAWSLSGISIPHCGTVCGTKLLPPLICRPFFFSFWSILVCSLYKVCRVEYEEHTLSCVRSLPEVSHTRGKKSCLSPPAVGTKEVPLRTMSAETFPSAQQPRQHLYVR